VAPYRRHEAVKEGTEVHGEYWLHGDYQLAIVPLTASLALEFDKGRSRVPEDDASLHHSKATLASSHNRLKLFISLIQAIWAIITLYRARGDQIHEYG
jgi:hypothetical protein